MAPNPEPGWQIYKEQMTSWCHGDALWQPAPTHNYQRISIGDVGFIRCGQFHLLFSAARPQEEQPEREVPDTFEEMQPDAVVATFSQPRPPGSLHTDTVREFGAGIGASASVGLPLEPGASFSFELTGKRGAALVTRYQTYKQDALKRAAFERYTKKHYESWVAFSREKEYGDDVKPVLVSGVDMTKDFAMAAYSNEGTSLEADLTISVPILASASASIWGTWRTRGLAHTNYGPQQCIPPSLVQTVDSPLQSMTVGAISDDYNQCIFVRYYTMRMRMGFIPRVMRAASGPHDLGSGQNHDSTFPELTAWPVGVPDTEDDSTSGHETRNSTSGNSGSVLNVVVRNVPDEDYDGFDAIAEYVFENSNATSTLMHHRDLAEIREAGGAGDISFLLAKNRPRIAVDESGVGRIVCREDTGQRLADPDTTPPYQLASSLQHSRDHDPSQNTDPTMTHTVGTIRHADGTKNPKGRNISLQSLNRDQVGQGGSGKASGPTLYGMSGVSSPTKEGIALIAGGNLDPEGIPQLLDKTLDTSDYPQALHSYPEPQRFIDGLYDIFRHGPPDSSICRRCLLGLREAGGEIGLLPTEYHVSFPLNKQNARPNAAGGSSDVWRTNRTDGTVFALKVFRVTERDDFPIIKKMFCKELLVAKQAKDDNVLAIEGVQIIEAHTLCIISEWMDNGNLLTYLEENADADRTELLSGVAKGLSYLHSIEVIHGDLKGPNILIDPNGNPRLTDFGLSSVTWRLSVSTPTPNWRDSTPWRAPELLVLSTKSKDQDKVGAAWPTEKSDIYSLAMVVIEIFTGKQPFYPNTDERVILLLAQDVRPAKPDHNQLTPTLWTLTKKCWDKDPKKRPNVTKVLTKLGLRDGKKRYKSLTAAVSTFFDSGISLQSAVKPNVIR